MADTRILFSPALVAHLLIQEASRRAHHTQPDPEDVISMSTTDVSPPPIPRARIIGATTHIPREYTLPTLLGMGVLGAGLGLLYSRTPGILQQARSRLSSIPISPGLIYTFSATNLVCAGAMLYIHQKSGKKDTDMVAIHRDLLSGWEAEATRRAKGRNLALAEHYEAHMESLQAEQKKIQREIERHNRRLQISQTATLATLVEAQRTIHDAERRARNAATDAQDIVRRTSERVSRLEADKAAMISRIRQLEADSTSLQASVRAAEQKADWCLKKVTEIRKRAPGSVETPPGTSVSDLWFDEG